MQQGLRSRVIFASRQLKALSLSPFSPIARIGMSAEATFHVAFTLQAPSYLGESSDEATGCKLALATGMDIACIAIEAAEERVSTPNFI